MRIARQLVLEPLRTATTDTPFQSPPVTWLPPPSLILRVGVPRVMLRDTTKCVSGGMKMILSSSIAAEQQQQQQPAYGSVSPTYAQPASHAQPTYAQPTSPAYAEPASPAYAQPASPAYGSTSPQYGGMQIQQYPAQQQAAAVGYGQSYAGGGGYQVDQYGGSAMQAQTYGGGYAQVKKSLKETGVDYVLMQPTTSEGRSRIRLAQTDAEIPGS